MPTTNEQSGALRFGHVTEYDPELHAARVEFADRGIVSHWLPVLTVNTLKNHDEVHLDVGEHVACILQGNGTEQGVILGAVFDQKNKPPVHEANQRAHTFEDDTQMLYDRENHQLKIDCVGDIEITTKGNVNITAGGNINITASGNIKEQASRIDLN